MPKRYQVLKDDMAVLDIVDEPGPLTSVSAPPPPPGSPAAQPHAFLSANALVATEEHQLRQLLLASVSTEEYLDRLREAGYVVVDQ